MQRAKLLRSVLSVVLLSVLAGPASAAQITTLAGVLQEKGYVAVRMKRYRNHALVRASVNGSPLDLVVDTGASGTVLERDAAYRAGNIKMTQEKEAATGALGKMKTAIYTSEVASLKVGDFDGGKTPISIARMSESPGRSINSNVAPTQSSEGLLGIDYLNRHRAVIDCFALNIFFAPATGKPASAALAAGLKAGGYTEIPLRIAGSALLAPVTIKGKSGYLMVDTGAPHTLLASSVVAATKLRRAGAGGMGIRDVSGEVTGLLQVELEDTRIGTFPIPKQWVACTDPGTRVGSAARDDLLSTGSDRFGYLGQDLLAYYVGIIDCGALKLYLRLDPGVEAARIRQTR